MNNRRAKLMAGATVVGLGALGGAAMATNPGTPSVPAACRERLRRGGDQRQRRGRVAGRRDAGEHPPADRHPRQRRRYRDRGRRLSRETTPQL